MSKIKLCIDCKYYKSKMGLSGEVISRCEEPRNVLSRSLVTGILKLRNTNEELRSFTNTCGPEANWHQYQPGLDPDKPLHEAMKEVYSSGKPKALSKTTVEDLL